MVCDDGGTDINRYRKSKFYFATPRYFFLKVYLTIKNMKACLHLVEKSNALCITSSEFNLNSGT
jgi:hypothetical protein